MQTNNTGGGFLRSKDGTPIFYQKSGNGPALILIGGGLDDGKENTPLAGVLSNEFTVYNYARRGRGQSGDTLPYAVQREVEDIQTLISVAGGGVCVFGASSGGALTLVAASAGLPIVKLAVYEIPYIAGERMAPAWQGYTRELHHLLKNDQREDALELFMRFAGSGDNTIQEARRSESWEPLTRLAHTLAYDAACMDSLQPDELRKVAQPALVLTGHQPTVEDGMEEAEPDFFSESAKKVISLLPNASGMVISGASHVADPGKLAPALVRFFKG